jgi:hypothetical protein
VIYIMIKAKRSSHNREIVALYSTIQHPLSTRTDGGGRPGGRGRWQCGYAVFQQKKALEREVVEGERRGSERHQLEERDGSFREGTPYSACNLFKPVRLSGNPVPSSSCRNKINKTSTYSTSLASARYLYSRSCVVE